MGFFFSMNRPAISVVYFMEEMVSHSRFVKYNV